MASAEPAGTGLVDVEVAYATPLRQTLISVRVPAGSSLAQAISSSGILQRHREIDLALNAVGVFGEVADPGQTVCDGDRIEIYRALVADPKQSRRRRAAAKKKRPGR